MRFENHQLRLAKILERELERSQQNVIVSGTTSPSFLAALLTLSDASFLSSFTHLVVTSDESISHEFSQSVRFFNPDVSVPHFPASDVSFWSGGSMRADIAASRIQFLDQAESAKPGAIFVSSVDALMQRTLPYLCLRETRLTLKVGDEITEAIFEKLAAWGYRLSSLVEDLGQFARRGGVIDVFSPAHSLPIRFELFGDEIVSIRLFDPLGQKSSQEIAAALILPAREVIWNEQTFDHVWGKTQAAEKTLNSETKELIHGIQKKIFFDGIDFFLPWFYEKSALAFDHFNSDLMIWRLDDTQVRQRTEQFLLDMQSEKRELLRPPPELLFSPLIAFENAGPLGSRTIEFSSFENDATTTTYSVPSIQDFKKSVVNENEDLWKKKFFDWKKSGVKIFIAISGSAQNARIEALLRPLGIRCLLFAEDSREWQTAILHQGEGEVHLVRGNLADSFFSAEDDLLFLTGDDLLGKKSRAQATSRAQNFQDQVKRLHFADLREGDYVVHTLHGVGIFEGLRTIEAAGLKSEYILIRYRDQDRLYLPVFRVSELEKHTSPSATTSMLDKLGGSTWEKTKLKVRSSLRDLAADLLKIYAERAAQTRDPLPIDEIALEKFERSFPFEETIDQQKAINDVLSDLRGSKPMDRLICGDVGFGKTEVALRGIFAMVTAGKQVAILAPTTVLTLQHYENFKKRLAPFGIKVEVLNRFIDTKTQKKILAELRTGEVQVLIGTHRLFSKDIVFSDLGLLIVDEEQKFGVAHKEKIRRLRVGVDTIAMSATPIPRTLNMSLMGIRDLSLISTPPVDRLPSRTFVIPWTGETIQKAVESEIKRGGQVFFIHNRVQSIHGVADELRKLLPDVRMKVAHGQMDEAELEKTILEFFHHEIDLLLCTTIVESGVDIPKANTMFVDQAQMMGLSQLYQLRGRVGRSKERAYCYLMVPSLKALEKDAAERLKVLQENTALGSGFRVAHYDLELRGAGDLLGEDQSGHIDAVGYELFVDLLEQTLAEMKSGKVYEPRLEPEVQIRIPARIPDEYVPDIRLRLSYYRALSDANSAFEIEKIEGEMRDQLGPLPDDTLNLLGISILRIECRNLGIRDLSAGPKNIALLFTEHTPLSTETFLKLVGRENKKYQVGGSGKEQKLLIRMNEISWPRILEELKYLASLAK